MPSVYRDHEYPVQYGFYNLASYSLYAAYTKLCLANAPGGACDPIPYGHGNVLTYEVAP